MGCDGVCTSKISVWWDIENCPIPSNVDPHLIAQNISAAVHHANYEGPLTIDVFGDTKHYEQMTLEALSSTGISINHIPSGNKDAADKAILVAMLFWALDNPAPANFLLISGDGDFANALHRLRMKRYTVLLARPDQPIKPALLGAATSVWYWTTVAKGQVSSLEHVERKGNIVRSSSLMPSKIQLTSNNGDDEIRLDMSSFRQSIENAQTSTNQSATGSLYSQEVVAPVKGQVLDTGSLVRHGGGLDLRKFLPIDKEIASIRRMDKEFSSIMKMGLEEVSSEGEEKTKQDSYQQSYIDHGVDTNPSVEECIPHLSHRCDQAFDPHGGSLLGVLNGLRHSSQVDMQPISHGRIQPNDVYPCRGVPFKADDKFICISGHRKPLNKALKALQILEESKLKPTKASLMECMCFRDKHLKRMDAQNIIDMGICSGEIVLVRSPGDCICLPPDSKLWNYVNSEDMLHDYPNELWTDFCEFLWGASDSLQAFLQSKSMYEAAYILKEEGLKKRYWLSVGHTYHLLCQCIWKKRWLSFHGDHWPCLFLNAEALKGATRVKELNCGSVRNGIPSQKKDRPAASISSPAKLAKLRSWLVKASRAKAMENYDISLVPKDFELDTGIYLNYAEFGYSRFRELLESFCDIVCIKEARKGLLVLQPVVRKSCSMSVLLGFNTTEKMVVPNTSKTYLLQKLREWLVQSPNLKLGYDISKLKMDFEQETGIILDYTLLGYAKFKDMVCDLSDYIRIESPARGVCLAFPKESGYVRASRAHIQTRVCNADHVPKYGRAKG